MTIREWGQAISKFFEALGQGFAKAWDQLLDTDLALLGGCCSGLSVLLSFASDSC